MKVEWVDRVDQLDCWLDDWRALAVRQGRPYSLPEWSLAWWRHASPANAELRVLILREGSEVVGVGPFFIDRRFGLRRLRILGAGTSSSVALLVEPGKEQSLVEAIHERILNVRDAHVMMLEGVPGLDHWLERLTERGARNGNRLHEIPGWEQPSPMLDLAAGGYEDWFSRKGSRFRARMRRGQRQLESLGGRHVLVSSPDQIEVQLREFERLHSLRWKARGGSGVLTKGVVAMLSDFARTSPKHFRIWTVVVEDRSISVQVFLTAGGTVCHWLGGVDDSIDELHPAAGVLSLHAALEHAWKAGDRLFDFGAGGQEFKTRFAGGKYQLQWTGLARARWCTLPATFPGLGERTRLAVARRLTPTAKRRLRAVQSRLKAPGE